MLVTCLTHLSPLDVITLIILVKDTDYETPYYVIFSVILILFLRYVFFSTLFSDILSLGSFIRTHIIKR